MKYVYAFIIKYIMTAVILQMLMYLLTQLSFREILMISLAVTLVSFLMGDLLILRISTNASAALSNAVLSFLTLYAFNFIPGYENIDFIDALVCAAVIGVGESVFHKYMARSIYPDRR
jgi:hypothetical protein